MSRYSKEAQQEDRSLGQFKERLAEVEWAANRLERDVGEDLVVQIHDEQMGSTGLSFYVQLKSVTDAERKRPKRGPEVLRYRLEVKDLKHWARQTTLVVLVVWDVEKREGFWETVPRIVAALDEGGKAWRDKKTATVSVPVEQGTDAVGLRKLRWAVADHSFESVATRASSEMTLTFPGTEQGNEMRRAFEEALDKGERVVFEGDAIPELERPEWYRRLYGDRDRIIRLEIEPSRSSEFVLPVRVEACSREGSAAVPYVELRVIKQGRKSISLSNEHQNLPFVFTLAGGEIDGGEFNFRRTRFGRTLQEAREATAFLLAVRRPGSRLRVLLAETGKVILDLPVPASEPAVLEALKGLHETLERLAFIEPRIVIFGTLDLAHGISHDDAAKIDLLFRICRDGKIKQNERLFSAELAPSAQVPTEPDDAPIMIHRENYSLKLLGVQIPLGRVKDTVEEPWASILRRAVLDANSSGRPVRVQMDDFSVTTEFLDWPLPRDRLYDIASAQAGNFTLAQASEAGFASAEQLETEERVERCGGNVFRLLSYPRSDREDLVVLWLQTDRKGVFSHDTALALHELSDILPSRRHITVPPGWEPPPDTRLDQDSVLHRAEIDPSEITWYSPVPLTRPLRTIRDCIEDHLSPDLVEQAIDDALRRGMISRTDAQDLRAARARSA